MARYGAAHKAETRRRVIETAGRRIKLDGIDTSGIATLMSDADLTNGAFYAHFTSKSDLVANVLADQLDRQRASIHAIPAGRQALETFIRDYLSAAHRDDRAGGCPTAALLAEVARSDAPVQTAYSEGAQAILAEIAAHLPVQQSAVDRNRTALGLFTVLVATLQLARAINDPDFSTFVLDAGVRNALQILGGPN